MDTEPLLLALHEDDPLARQQRVDFRALADQPLVLFPTGGRPSFLDKVLGLCQQAGFVPTIAQEVGDAVTAVSLVSKGFGACLVSQSTAALSLPGLTYRRWTAFRATRGSICRASTAPTTARRSSPHFLR